jgi:hypothetical protein
MSARTVLLDRNPRELESLLRELIRSPCQLLLALEERVARLEPLVPGCNLEWRHGRGFFQPRGWDGLC